MNNTNGISCHVIVCHLKQILSIALIFTTSNISGQIRNVRDTLKESVIVGMKKISRETGIKTIQMEDLLNMVSATGESDAIKYIQTLPGVATGGESSSAFYVRGGNTGNNVLTLDGTRIYGTSHLLGFSTIFSPHIIDKTSFQIGGFTSEDGNFTASHIKLKTSDGCINKTCGNVSASNFLFSSSLSTPVVKDKLSFIGSLRISPIALEVKALKALSSALDSIGRPRAVVYDLFGKFRWSMNNRNSMSLSFFNSIDAYSYTYGSDSYEHLKWSNTVTNLIWDSQLNDCWSVEGKLSYNRFNNAQGMVKNIETIVNDLAIHSSVHEITLNSMAKYIYKSFYYQAGIQGKFASFNPATSHRTTGNLLMTSRSKAENHTVDCLMGTAHMQFEAKKDDNYHLRAAGRIHCYRSYRTDISSYFSSFNPEASLLARINICRWFGAEATTDWTVQYYHTLEGIPLGWSLDLIIPSDNQLEAEKATQYYYGIFLNAGNHHLTIGRYKKKMKGLIYFTDATALFNSSIAGWREKIDIGKGFSDGYEFLYEKTGKKLNCRVAYTYSTTTRSFHHINEGLSFPAKFHRPHIFNVHAAYTMSNNTSRTITLNTLFTFQSGHRETVASGKFHGILIDSPEYVQLKYLSSINNFKMPDYIRWDIGCSIRFKDKRYPQILNIGIYNILNRHNPFNLTYDTKEHTWKKISIFPIMPSLDWSIEF